MTKNGAVDENPGDEEQGTPPISRETGFDADEDEMVEAGTGPRSPSSSANADASSDSQGTDTTMDSATSGDEGRVTVPRKFLDAKEGRDSTVFYLTAEQKRSVKRLKHHLEDSFPDENVRKLDVYAALVEVGLEDFEETEEQLEEWGYGKQVE